MKKIRVLTIILLVLTIFNVEAKEIDFNIYSKHAILYNIKEEKIVLEKAPHEKTSIASLTKITTAIVAIENIKDLDQKVVLTNDDFKGIYEANLATAGFKVGEEVTYRDLLYGLLLPSGADAAQSLARNIAGSNDEFVKLMNKKAKDLKLENTHYVNTTGLDDPNHYSTANDVLTVFKYALKNEDFRKIITSSKYTTSDNILTFKSTLSKVNIGMDYVLGGKTGATGDAGLCLATLANYDDTEFILVTTNVPMELTAKQFLDHKTIHEYTRDNYDYLEVVNKKDVLVKLKTKYIKEDELALTSSKNISLYLDSTFNKKELVYKYKGMKEITPSMKKGEKIGRVDVYYDDELLTTVPIVLKEKPKFSLIKYLLGHKLIVGIIFILMLLIAVKFIKRKGKGV